MCSDYDPTADAPSSSSPVNAGSGSGPSGRAYIIISSGINLQGNHHCFRDYGPSATNPNSYHYSNRDGSYYYSNPEGSTYYNTGNGYSR